jgi:ABC-type multidrug transport system ATPase subunit
MSQRAPVRAVSHLRKKKRESAASLAAKNAVSEEGKAEGPLMLAFSDLNIIDTDSQRTLLHDVSGFVVKGGITGVIGPSSSGKTLLMKALAGRMDDAYYTGDVVLDGRILDPKHSRVAFEDEQLVGVLTVRESLELSMQLRRNVTRAESQAAVTRLLGDLELAHVADNAIGTVLKRGLSGGQKRRASVGVELVAKSCEALAVVCRCQRCRTVVFHVSVASVACPMHAAVCCLNLEGLCLRACTFVWSGLSHPHAAVIFIDEPTSGLDAAAALNLMTHLRDMAQQSKGTLSIIVSVQVSNQV